MAPYRRNSPLAGPPERHVPPIIYCDRLTGSWSWMVEAGAVFVLQHCRAALDPPELMIRMRLIGYCFGIRSGTALVRRGPPQLGIPLVLPSGSGARWRRARPFDLQIAVLVAKRRGFREMELELFGYLGDLKPGDISHPARAKRLVLACSFRHGASRRWAGGNRLGSSQQILS